jgi:hypothetical protein
MPARVPAFHALTGPLAPLPAVFVFIPSFFSLSWCRVRRVGEDSNPNSLARHGQRYKYYAGKGAGVPCSYRTAGTPAGSLCLYPFFLFLSWCSVRRVGEDSNPNSLARHGQRYKYYAGKGAGVPCSYWTAGNLPAVFVFIPSFFSCPGVVFAVSAKIPIQIPLPDTGNATHIMPARVPAFHENNQ